MVQFVYQEMVSLHILAARDDTGWGGSVCVWECLRATALCGGGKLLEFEELGRWFGKAVRERLKRQ